MGDDIEILRARIAELDAAILRLLAERFAHVRLLGRTKALAGLAIEDPAHAAELREAYLLAAQREGLDPALVSGLFAAVHEHSEAVQRNEARRPKSA